MAHELAWDQARAQRESLRAIELKPNYAYGIHWYAHYLEAQRQFDEAAKTMKRALSIDPLSRLFTVDLAMLYYKERRFADALREVQRAQELDPDYPLYGLCRAMMYQATNRCQYALAVYHQAVDIARAACWRRRERWIAARREYAALQEDAQKTCVPDYLLALVAYALKDREQGRIRLKRSVDSHSGLLVWLRTAPLFDLAAADTVGNGLLERVGNFSQ